MATHSESHDTVQHSAVNSQTTSQQPASSQFGVECTRKQLPVPEPPQTEPLQSQAEFSAAACTQGLSQETWQQNGSVWQTRVQQAESEQLGSGLTTQQFVSRSLPHGGTGQASSLPVQEARASDAQTLSQSVSQQYGSELQMSRQQSRSLQAPLSCARQQSPAQSLPHSKEHPHTAISRAMSTHEESHSVSQQ